jgi:predicted MFS family arabinose efflux permease
MVALKVGSYAFPREQAAMMSGIASGSFALVNAILSPRLGQLLDQRHYAALFWIIALCPLVGVLVWLFLSRNREAQPI